MDFAASMLHPPPSEKFPIQTETLPARLRQAAAQRQTRSSFRCRSTQAVTSASLMLKQIYALQVHNEKEAAVIGAL
jgi:hypothetical protein